MFFKNKTRYLLILILSAIGVLQLLLLGRGACALGDEFRYWYSAYMLIGLSAGDFTGFISPMFDTAGRPGLAIVQLPPVLIQSILFKTTGLDPRAPQSLLIPQVFNVLLSACIGGLIYRTSRKLWGFSRDTSVFIVLIYSLLITSTLYIRHLLPYQYGLAAFLFCMLHADGRCNTFLTGVLTAFAYSIYPGYWFLGVLVFFLTNPGQNTKKAALFLCGACVVLLTYEGLARFSGKSFLFGSATAARNFLYFLQFPYDGSFGLFWDYLWATEGLSGALFAVGAVFFFISAALKAFRKTQLSKLECAGGILLVCFVFQALGGYFSAAKVFYGRLFYPFAPFLLWFFMDILNRNVKRIDYQKAVFAVLTGICLFRFVSFYKTFYQLGYPRDLLCEMGYSSGDTGFSYDIETAAPVNDGLNRVCEFETPHHFTKPPGGRFGVRETPLPDSNFIFLNFASLEVPVYTNFSPFLIPENRHWIVKRLHYGAFEPYWFEESAERRRFFLKNKPLQLGILE
jgi:hypothetical protein